MQTAKKILMVRPAKFAYNEQTAKNNYFQEKLANSNLNDKALEEFDNFVNVLRDNEVEVIVVQDTEYPHTPDSIFPNNWFSTHPTGELVLYPMFAENRRAERKPTVLGSIQRHFPANKTIDLTYGESENKFLEGTGSIILDHTSKIAYACRSERTNEELFHEFCKQMSFEPVLFSAFDENHNPIYHTNVMLSVGENLAVICTESITDEKERTHVINSLRETKKEIVEISLNQMKHFCANVLEVYSLDNENRLIMSEAAKNAFTSDQKDVIKRHCKIISSPLQTIEQVGGGSARCMVAEIF
ncbi:MAG: arginine deiminase-related protein [Dysgonamonadaceae bacterium]|nr:arginine deiminase-related protein [Dysgonamonadaceae bacterium]HUI33230.1 arginine deiminase-related protein [Dysgonamonadaceae bacterium]